MHLCRVRAWLPGVAEARRRLTGLVARSGRGLRRFSGASAVRHGFLVAQHRQGTLVTAAAAQVKAELGKAATRSRACAAWYSRSASRANGGKAG